MTNEGGNRHYQSHGSELMGSSQGRSLDYLRATSNAAGTAGTILSLETFKKKLVVRLLMDFRNNDNESLG
eukprot:scaffold305664_cov48-Prasinocladus_malaysianus.AAC.2